MQIAFILLVFSLPDRGQSFGSSSAELLGERLSCRTGLLSLSPAVPSTDTPLTPYRCPIMGCAAQPSQLPGKGRVQVVTKVQSKALV